MHAGVDAIERDLDMRMDANTSLDAAPDVRASDEADRCTLDEDFERMPPEDSLQLKK